MSTEGTGPEPQSVARMGSVTLDSCIWRVGSEGGLAHLHVVPRRAVPVVGQVHLDHGHISAVDLTCWKVNERKFENRMVDIDQREMIQSWTP